MIKSLINQSDDLCVPTLEYIGLNITDLVFFGLANRNDFLIKLNEYDKRIANNLIAKFKDSENHLVKQVGWIGFCFRLKRLFKIKYFRVPSLNYYVFTVKFCVD